MRIFFIQFSCFFVIYLFPFFLFAARGQQSVVDSLEKVLKLAKEDTGKVSLLNDITWEYWGNGSYDTAMFYGNAALELALKLNFRSGIGVAYNNTGLVYYSRGLYPQALDCFFRSLKENEGLWANVQEQDTSVKNKYRTEIARNFGNIGLVYGSQNDNSKALEYYLKA